MKSDFTRGHRPDKKRGEKYRRVLLQEGRLITDSDMAAGVDAVDTLLRDLATDLGCVTGSPDLGYLATPGPLLAVFETLDGVVLPAPGGLFKAYRDYGAKYQDRFPSIYIGAQAASGSVTVTARRKLSSATHAKIRFWIKANAQVDVRIEGVAIAPPIAASDATKFLPYDVAVPAGVVDYQQIEIGFSAFGPANEAWVGLIEAYEPAQTTPRFWFTRGRYYLRGLSVESEQDGSYSDAAFPASKGFPSVDVVPAAGGYLLAYVEGWERLITRIEDPGILEQALGGVLDTTVRSKALGQVKVALFANGNPLTQADDVPKAFASIDVGAGKLKVTTKVTTDNLDPCAIPEAGGYTGADNRLYRFEVHAGGALGTTDLKWSRNNGSEAFAVAAVAVALTDLTLAPGAEVKDGELIELVAETDDLGDAAAASVSLVTPSFKPSVRRTGHLFYAETTATSGQIKLRDLTTKLAVPVPAGFANNTKGARLVRVWHGRLVTKPEKVGDPIVTKFDIGDGIVVELSGSDFRPGDYWQHEARKIKDNQNGPWRELPHGPERLFAPLALFRYDGGAVPLALIRWYDHQYSALCELNADDIAYDGTKAGTTADTVQEALDELYSKQDGGCCDLSLAPAKTPSDDTARLQKAIDDVVEGGTICLQRGVYRVLGKLGVVDKRVTIAGCPHATVVGGNANDPVFYLSGDGQLGLRDLLVVLHEGPEPVVRVIDKGKLPHLPFLSLLRTALVHTGKGGIAVRVGELKLSSIDPEDPRPISLNTSLHRGAAIRAEDSVLVSASGIVAQHLDATELYGSLVVFGHVGIFVKGAESVRICRSNLQGWLTSDDLQPIRDAKPEDLEWAVSSAVENGAGNAPQPESIAIVAGELRSQGSLIESSSLSARTALLVGGTSNLVSRGNQYLGSAGPAIRIDIIENTRFSQDRIHVRSGIGFWAPWWTRDLQIEECEISGSIGIGFAAAADGARLPGVLDIYSGVFQARIHGNQITGGDRGVAFGPSLLEAEPSPPFIALGRVEVTSNTIHAQTGVACTVLDPPRDEGNPRMPRLCIAGNTIDASVGVLGLGNDLVLRDNTIHSEKPLSGVTSVLGLPLLGAGQVGLYLADGGRTIVSGNVVDLDPSAPAEEGGSVGILLHEISREGDRAGIQLRDNTVTASRPLWIPKGQTGASARDLLVDANYFSGSSSLLFGVQFSTVRGNTFVGGLTMDGGWDNVVSANALYALAGPTAALHITSAWRTWQVEDNRAFGTLLIQPITLPYTPEVDKYAAFIEYVLFWRDPVNGGGVGTMSVQEAKEWFAFYLNLLNLKSIDRELEYAAQVEGNWTSRDLVVGYPPAPFTTPSTTYPTALADIDSGIQIVGNRANNSLITNGYGRLVFANNFAQSYVIPDWRQVGPIVFPNLDAP